MSFKSFEFAKRLVSSWNNWFLHEAAFEFVKIMVNTPPNHTSNQD
jgi:hypothetical protein